MARAQGSAATLVDAAGTRRTQLIEMTIDSLAEVGYVESTLTRIGRRAGVSAGLVAHYFADKDGLLEATFRSLVARLGARMRARMQQAHTPRGRVQAIIDANLAAEEFDRRTGTAWPERRCTFRAPMADLVAFLTSRLRLTVDTLPTSD